MSKALEAFRADLGPGDRMECTENTYWTRPEGIGHLPPIVTVTKNGPTVCNGTYQQPNQHGIPFERTFGIDWPLARDILESSPDMIRYRFWRKSYESYTVTWRKLPPAPPAFELRIVDIDTRLAEARAQLAAMQP